LRIDQKPLRDAIVQYIPLWFFGSFRCPAWLTCIGLTLCV
jgi:hypothetical protein